MLGIPPSTSTDAEDVVWALQTADALWKRSERADAIVWLRRAAQAAGEAEDDDRALSLAREAAELAEWMAQNAAADSEHIPAEAPAAAAAAAVEVDVLLSVPPPSLPPRPAPFSSTPPRPSPRSPAPPRPASLSPSPPPPPATPLSPSPPPAPATPMSPSPPPAPATPMSPPPLRVVPPPPPSAASLPSPAPPAVADRVQTGAEVHAGMLDPWAETEAPTNEHEPVAPAAPPAVPPARAAPVESETPTPTPAAVFAEEEVVTSARREPGVDLSTVEALSDLPDDARDAFAGAAKVHDLGREDEVSGFALALVVEGSVELMATIIDTPAQRLDAGAILRSRGTIEHAASMRLVGASDRARVATWDDRAVADAFNSCPWVEDDLRAAGDRHQALVGVTMGPLGERLDPTLRADVTNRLALRVLAEHEVCAARGTPVPGLLVVGAGELELLGDDGTPNGTVLAAGEFLFAAEALRAAPAPNTVRAAKGGALVLFAERGLAQELLVTCPPLLEIFAGM